MSLFKKNVPLQEVAPVMQEYTGQHPVLNFKVSAIVKSDHLDQYMEVHPFASSEPRLSNADLDEKFKTGRNKKQLRKLRSKIKLIDGQSDEKSLNDFIKTVVKKTPGIICHRTTTSEMTLRSDKIKVDDTPLTYYFFPAVEDITGLTDMVSQNRTPPGGPPASGELIEGGLIEPEILKQYFYGGPRNFKEKMDTWILDKIVNM
tara:strand:- start:664 stop:1272 length:609 start_codon:yes stop_codon:yes gene_type:complete